MMLFASISFIFLLLHCAPQEVTSESNGDICCDSFNTTEAPATPLLPSENFVITASCSCKTNNYSYCPMMVVGKEAEELVSFRKYFVQNTSDICEVRAIIKPLLNKFSKRSIEVPLTVSAPDNQRTLTARFQKSGNAENCTEDADCLHSWDQICDNGRCSCYGDVPSFVKIEEKCFTASEYDEICKYDEQCMTSDINSVCCDRHRRCKCRDGYKIKSESDLTCVSDSPTTSTTETTTTTTTDTTTTETTTEGPSPTVSPSNDCCDYFEITSSSATLLLPTEKYVLRANCSCKTNNETYCPVIDVGAEAKNFTSLEIVNHDQARNICVVQVAIKPLQSKFTKRSMEVPVSASAPGKQNSRKVRFQKSDNGENCMEDLDCWHSLDQVCDNGRCSCYKDVPSFVKFEEKCFTASKYGQRCKYDEQCMSSDNQTVCSDDVKRCKCRDGFWIRSASDTTCVTGFSAKVTANQFMVYVTAIYSVILFSRMM